MQVPTKLLTGSLLFLVFLAGCAQTYWAFPPGRSAADFRVDELRCQMAVRNLAAWSVQSCLTGLGYREISSDQYVEMQRQAKQQMEAALKPMDIAAYDITTQEIFVGRSEPFISKKSDGSISSRAAVKIEGLITRLGCAGQAELDSVTATGTGSFGTASLLCKDGRTIQAVFTYESSRSGYGIGSDSFGKAYRFVFGDLDLKPDELRKRFQELVKKFPTSTFIPDLSPTRIDAIHPPLLFRGLRTALVHGIFTLDFQSATKAHG